MPWHIPADFKHFKEITLGKPCIMGRKTYESILDQLGKPLPGRTSIVISRTLSSGRGLGEGNIVVSSLEDAILEAQKITDNEVMIIGGAQIYKMSTALANKIYLTRVHQSPEGDAFFPELGEEWKETKNEEREGFSFIDLERIEN
jgi:dihydrofolate reductase